MPKPVSPSLTYADAGVNIGAGNQLVHSIKDIARRTKRPEVMGGIGGFASLFEIPMDRYQHPVIVSSTDGVGTKLLLAMNMQQHDTIGIDLVAMCANDVICQGAEPAFFLDYFATGELNLPQAEAIIRGIGEGCSQANMTLIGGETAEMPGMYSGEDYDLAGFCVGIVEKSRIIDGPKHVNPGDQLIGLASSGAHSNGFSLIRRVLQLTDTPLTMPFNGSTIGETLLTPTRLYVNSIMTLLSQVNVHAIAHITGGGLLENLPRVMPAHTSAHVYQSRWQWPEIFHWLQTRGNIASEEMLRTFNVGIGMVVCVAAKDVDQALSLLRQSGEEAMLIGEIQAAKASQPSITLHES